MSRITNCCPPIRAPGCLGSIGLVLLAVVTSAPDCDARTVAANVVVGVVVAKKGDSCRYRTHSEHNCPPLKDEGAMLQNTACSGPPRSVTAVNSDPLLQNTAHFAIRNQCQFVYQQIKCTCTKTLPPTAPKNAYFWCSTGLTNRGELGKSDPASGRGGAGKWFPRRLDDSSGTRSTIPILPEQG